MADQEINYKVRLDDSDMQARLSQMRASIDQTVMGGYMAGGMPGMYGAGMMGMGGMSGPLVGGMFNMYSGGAGMGGMGGGLADFGSQIRPITYTPPAIAMQPHFGMVAVQQTFRQAAAGMLGPVGMALNAPFAMHDQLPAQISLGEYMALSTRGFSARAGDMAATGALTVGSTAGSILAGAAGASLGASALGGFPLGSAVGGLLGGAMGGMAVSAYADAVSDMMANNRATQAALASGSFRFIGGGRDVDPLTGRGFSRAARADVARSVQDLELRDVRFGMDEYRNILESGMQMDMFSGTRDAEDFKTKFKSLVENVKTVASTLHTSLQEGIEAIRGFRDMGVTDPNAVNRMVLGAEAMGRMSGRTGMEMLAIGQTGAEMFRGTGIRMALGAELNQQNAVTVRSLLDQGLISRELVGQAGGENALAQQITANTLSAFQTAMGRGAMMANFDPRTGQFRPDMVGRMMGQDAFSMVAGAANLSAAGIFKLQAHQAELISEMDPMQMRMFSISKDMAEARTVAAASGADIMDVYKSMRLRRGESHEVIGADIAFMQQDPEKFKQDQETALESVRAQAAMEDFRNRFGFKRITNAIRRSTIQPLYDALMGVSGAIEQEFTDLGMSILGVSVAPRIMDKSLVESGRKAIEEAGGVGAVVDVRGNILQRSGIGQSGADFGETVMSGMARGESGDLSYRGEKVMEFSDRQAAKDYADKVRDTIHILGERDGKLIGMSVSSEKKILDQARGFEYTSKDRKDAEEKVIKKDGARLREAMFAAAAARGGKVTLQDLTTIVTGGGATPQGLRGRGVDISTIEMLAEEAGDAGAEAREELKKLRGSTEISDTLAYGSVASAEESEGYRQKAASEVLSQLGYFSRFQTGDEIRNRLSEKSAAGALRLSILGKMGTLKKDSKEYQELRARLTSEKSEAFLGGTAEQREAALRKIEEQSAAEAGTLYGYTKNISIAQAQSQAQKEAGVGGQVGVGSEGVGTVALEHMSAIKSMSENLSQNYTQLINMQRVLNELIDKGRAGLRK